MADHMDASGRSLRPVVTLFESYGSGARYVGERVAAALGAPFHQQAFSSEELEDAVVKRESRGVLARVFGAMGSSFAGLEGPGVATAQRDNYELVMENTRTVKEAAQDGGVIVGRNGALILHSRPGALHVMLDGPLQQRIERAAKESGIDTDRAARRQKIEDRIRADMSIELYGWDPRSTDRYDLVVNTGRMALDTCAEIIVSAARIKAELDRPTPP